MNLVGLVLHGLAAFFVYSDIIGARLMVAAGALAALGLAVLPFLPLPLAAVVTLILTQTILAALILVFTVMSSRTNGFLPVRDCPYFVDRVERIHPADGPS